MRAYLWRTLALTAVVVGAVSFAGSAAASGPTSLGATGWQIYASSAQYGNPDPLQIHGEVGEYAGAPATPAQDDAGWVNCGANAPRRFTVNMCPNASTIGMSVTSVLGGCWANLNFTWFQALVSIPAGTTISQFSVNMSGADDGARVSLVNSAHPNGVTPGNGYIFLGGAQSTGDLSPYVVAGEVNRVVITQVDDCASGNNLGTAKISLNGTVIVPDTTAPSDAPVVSPAANAFGWNNSDVSVAWNWTDSGSNASGIDTANCTQSSGSSGEGTQALSSTCSDLAGNSRSDARTVKVDETAPADSPTTSVSGTTVSVDWNWTDGLSGIDSSNCTQSSSNSGNGLVTVSSTCSDRAGNSSSDSVQVQVDGDPPVDSPSAVPAWSNGDVTVDWNWTDAGSGIDPNNCRQSSTSTGEGAIVLSSTCFDLAGNSATDSVTVHVDKTAPAASPAAPSGWQTSDATVQWNWTDGGSGLADCTQSSTSTGEGTITLTSTCSDVAGNSTTATATVQVDKTAPSADPSAPAGWQNADQTVTWNWSDGGSGIDASHCTQSTTSSGEGTITLHATCTDVAGNTGSASATVQVDKTAPSAAPVAPTGWHNTDQTVAWNWTDGGGSGIDTSKCAQSSTSSGAGTITLDTTCFDVAGNSASASATVKVDKTDPTVTYTGGGTYTVDQTVSITCTAADEGGSGLASSTCENVSGAAWQLGLGKHDLSATAADNAGNTGSGSTSYTVKVDADSLCALVTRWAKNAGQANSLCVKLRAAADAAARGQTKTHDNNINAFDNEVSAQSGKGFTAAQAALLIQFAAAL